MHLFKKKKMYKAKHPICKSFRNNQAQILLNIFWQVLEPTGRMNCFCTVVLWWESVIESCLSLASLYLRFLILYFLTVFFQYLCTHKQLFFSLFSWLSSEILFSFHCFQPFSCSSISSEPIPSFPQKLPIASPSQPSFSFLHRFSSGWNLVLLLKYL